MTVLFLECGLLFLNLLSFYLGNIKTYNIDYVHMFLYKQIEILKYEQNRDTEDITC